ncbi:hypothetical protein TrVFT333_011463 [Trichoderma virens FT-333]|nr:hypothetical protein TrVFT333_011463 [Trichoderma virens FT-333]
MALELEGLIARLLLVISCAGEQGLSISEFNDAAKLALYLSDSAASFHNNQDVNLHDAGSKFSGHAVATIWKWLVRRTDISVGPHRTFNHLTFAEVLALDNLNKSRNTRPGLDFINGNGQTRQAVPSTTVGLGEHNDIRIHASQEIMWEAITGHAIDYKRVPRSEWLLLLGIASTKAQGILQGDLGRLVDQDKRSVPKRTDALVKKGYITKRTTLVRGTKTSKMWLKSFAPPLPKDRNTAAEPEAEMNLSRQVLAINLDAVPWHTRWTGESVDYTALATTIMAICKEWGVLRMQDLKSKLGVLGMRWQMKVVSKVCRFLNARDAIRYVAAKLNNKVFNDCVQFNRDLTPKDWSIFLATGKRAGKLARSSEFYSQDGHDIADSFLNQTASSKCLGVAPTWSSDQPLAATITKNIMACGEAGLTNPDVYGLTLGVSFTRFLSSLTTCISTPNIQPTQLQHLQVRSEHSRAGKVASYRYSLPTVLQSPDIMTTNIEQEDPERRTDSRLSYGFSKDLHPIGTSKLANLSQANLSQKRQRGRPRKIRSEHQNDWIGNDNNLQQVSGISHSDVNLTDENHSIARDSIIVKLKVPQDALRELMDPLLKPQAASQETNLLESESTTEAAPDALTNDTAQGMDALISPGLLGESSRDRIKSEPVWAAFKLHPHLREIDTPNIRDKYSKPDYETTSSAYGAGKTEAATASSQKSHGSIPGNMGGKEVSKKKSLRSEVADQISALLMDMLVQRDGVLPGGHSLWHALTTVWNSRYSEKPVPKTKDYQGALSRMIKSKSVLEHWHGFQDHGGLFAKCQVITLPHLDAFSSEVLAVVEKIKQRHPQLFIPTQFRSPSNDVDYGEKKENRRGRRILAGEVARLDAPVYAAQASAKRRHGMMSDITTPSKRRKFAQADTNSPNFASLSTLPHDKYQVRWAENSWLSDNTNVPSQKNPSMAHATHGTKIQFLTPNLFLEDDWSVNDHRVPQGTTRPLPFTDMDATFHGSPTPVAVKVTMTEPVRILGNDGNWPYLELQFFEEKSSISSFTLCGWMPDAEWFNWADIVQGLDKRISGNEMGRPPCTVNTEAAHDRFMKGLIDCLDLELAQRAQFINAPPLAAGPYNLFVNFSAGFETVTSLPDPHWQHQEQLGPQSVDRILHESEALTSSDDEDSEFSLDASVLRYSRRPLNTGEMIQSRVKRVALITRPLTSISPRETYGMDESGALETEEGRLTSQEDLLAAFVVVRVLLGGADKAIDWGLLLHIFPNMRLPSLRKFWAVACKEQGPHIKKFTRDVQERLIEALESHELPMVDFEEPIEYDWQMLIKWATRISRQEGYQIPQSRELLAHRFLLKASSPSEEDWCERYFHAQSSIFSRFEAVTSEPAALPVNRVFDRVGDNADAENADIARSWIKSLCCTGEAKYSVRKIKEKFLTLSREGTDQGSLLLKEAIDQLTAQRVICRSKKTPFGGRPYRLSEWYLSTLSRVAQRSKYEEAAAFKRRMDAIFRTGDAFEIPYTLNDGSMMALTNLNATGRITLVPMDIPNIPFGFEPGNYESRKYPKSYYHFRLQAVPTGLYQYSDDIAVLHAVTQEDLPSTTLKGKSHNGSTFLERKIAKDGLTYWEPFALLMPLKGPWLSETSVTLCGLFLMNLRRGLL